MINSSVLVLTEHNENMCGINDTIDPNYMSYFYMLEYTFFTLFGFFVGNTMRKLAVAGYSRCCRKTVMPVVKQAHVESVLADPIRDIVDTKVNDLEMKICNHNLKMYDAIDNITSIINNIVRTLLNTKQVNECKDKDAREEQVHQVYSGVLTLFSLNPGSDRNVVHIELINKSLFTVEENRRWLTRKLDQDFCNLYLKQIMFYSILVYGGSIHIKHSRIQHTITSWDGSIQCNITCNAGTVTISDLMSIQEKKHKIVWNHTLVQSLGV
jgi:hypothetical protein